MSPEISLREVELFHELEKRLTEILAIDDDRVTTTAERGVGGAVSNSCVSPEDAETPNLTEQRDAEFELTQELAADASSLLVQFA